MRPVIVDTCVWSLAFRKKTLAEDESRLVNFLASLIKNGRVVMLGPIRQEILSGISDRDKFLILKDGLESFFDFEIATKDYERAAELCNLCRSQGIQGSCVDFLICSVAKSNGFPILTLDKDFQSYSRCAGLEIVDSLEWLGE